MAIKFKSAPAPAEADQGGSLDFLALVDADGKFTVILLVIVVAVIYGVVLYLRATPGKRITDIKVKRKPDAEVAVRRANVPVPEAPAEPAEPR